MKKRKTYEISVIDRTYSKTISDETKFYTSDTALELGFELKETEYDFESAEIVLLNIDDRSLTTRPVSKVNNDFVYKIDDDITTHYGEWRGQLRFETGETYVSSPVKFRIENDLSNDRPPQLSDVQSWVSLKRYADSLTDELKQAVLSVEGIEDTFNANELERQTTFETAEQSRQGAFETNESERDRTFESNEATRQVQELEREKAETQRQTTFDSNEAGRGETFNANEATRKENETTRQQAETQRATAESSRASAEEQRKIDHANRSAELAGKADKVVIKNETVNGDFSSPDISHVTSLFDLEVIDGRLKASKSNWSYVSGAMIVINNAYSSWDAGDKYYVKAMLKVVGGAQYKMHFGSFNSKEDLLRLDINDYRELNSVSTVFSPDSNNFVLRPFLISAEYVEIILDDFVSINLTKTFGAGNEPTKEEMDELIKVTGYIDYEYALNNKDLLMWTLALIRSNKNAIITLGGTI